jgi:hypothetical protein
MSAAETTFPSGIWLNIRKKGAQSLKKSKIQKDYSAFIIQLMMTNAHLN